MEHTAIIGCRYNDRIMKTDTSTVFDLSPAEKLQLVEDLWDDLAATPEAVPVHDWQKQELARRKANLLTNPASGDRKSTRLNSSHSQISYAVFCLKKKKIIIEPRRLQT